MLLLAGTVTVVLEPEVALRVAPEVTLQLTVPCALLGVTVAVNVTDPPLLLTVVPPFTVMPVGFTTPAFAVSV